MCLNESSVNEAELMNDSNIGDTLAACVEEILSIQHPAKQKVNQSYYCVVRFHDESKVELFSELVFPLFGEFVRVDEFLFKLCNSYDITNKLSKDVESLIYQFDKKLISVPFEPTWLEHYFSNKGFGIDVVMASQSGLKECDIPSYIEEKRKDVIDRNTYLASIEENKDLAKKMTSNDIAKSFSDFLLANWTGFDSREHVITVVNEMIAFSDEFSIGRYQVPDHSCQKLIFALAEKSRNLFSGGAESNKTNGNHFSWYTALDGVVKKSNLHESWDLLRKSLRQILERETKTIAPKDFDRLLNDDDFKFDVPTPFVGIKFPFDIECDMNRRLSPSNLRYDVQEQGGKLNSLLAGAIAGYYLKWMELKQVAKIEDGLVNLASELDSIDIANVFDEIIKNCNT